MFNKWLNNNYNILNTNIGNMLKNFRDKYINCAFSKETLNNMFVEYFENTEMNYIDSIEEIEN